MIKLLICAILCAPVSAWAVLADCERATINTAIAAAAGGDTIDVPAGNCEWTSALTAWGTKTITLRGAGIGVTNITLSGAQPSGMNPGNNGSRITGFTFIRSGSADWFLQMTGQNWRVDHCRFEQSGTGGIIGIEVNGTTSGGLPHPTGLIDHCYFYRTKIVIQGNLDNKAAVIWNEASTIGNADQTGVVYVEDCMFDKTGSVGTEDVVDATAGGRYVFRHNSVVNGAGDVHGTQQSPTRFAGKSAEIYRNRWHSTETHTRAIQLRAGSVVVYDNVLTGDYISFVDIDNQRSYTLMTYPPDDCNGTSDFDGNDVGANGYPCRDQPGRGSDVSLWDGTTYPMPAQALEPMYFWGNTKGGVATNPQVINCTSAVKTNGSCADIVLGRDYYNTFRDGYSAYTYPHPSTGTVYAQRPKVRRFGGAQ